MSQEGGAPLHRRDDHHAVGQGREEAELLGRVLFAIPKGKNKKLRIRLTKARSKKLTKAKKGTLATFEIDARDGGSSLWQTTGTVRLRRR